MWRLADPLLDEGPVWFQHALAMAAHLARRHRSGRSVALRPLHHRRYRYAKPRRNSPAARAANNRRNHPLAQIIGKRSGHRMLAPYPASILNHKPRFDGIPTDSVNPGTALVL